MTKTEKLPLVIDYVFKRVFAYEGNEDVLADFLESILNIEIKKLKVKNGVKIDFGHESVEMI